MRSNVFPLYEVVGGAETTITHLPEEPAPPEAYFEMQGRFRPLLDDPEQLEQVKANIDTRWRAPVARHEATTGSPAFGTYPLPRTQIG
jgi:hypothetical protein